MAAPPRGWFFGVQPGVYAEDVTVDKSLTLRGAQARVDARSRSGDLGLESVVEGTSAAFTVGANDVTIDGFTITRTTAAAPFGVSVGAVANMVISDDIFTGNQYGVFATDGPVTGLDVGRSVFDANTAPAGHTAGVFLAGRTTPGAVIHDNAFRNQDDGSNANLAAINIGGNSSASPTDNARIVDNTSSHDSTFVIGPTPDHRASACTETGS